MPASNPEIVHPRQFNQLDNDNSNIGVDFNYLYKNINLFGEFSQSISAGMAHTMGLLAVLDPRLSIGLQHRNFERDFKPIQSRAIGESTNNTNEKGLFFGFESKLTEQIDLSAYADRFIFPWLRFRTDAPSNGQRLFAQMDYRPNKQLQMYFRYRLASKARNNDNIDGVVQTFRKNYRFHFNYQITNNIRLASRIEFSTFQIKGNNHENGLLVYQDLMYKQLNFPLSFSLRYALFDTESFDSRIYAYENDVLYAFSVPAFNGRGSRFYISSKYNLSRHIDIWLRFAQSFFSDRNFVGSGNDEIRGQTKSELKAQLRIKF